MVQEYAPILGPELTWYLNASTIDTPHRYLMQKIELLAKSELKTTQVDQHTSNMIRDVRNLLQGSREDHKLEELDNKLVLISLPTNLSNQLSVLKPRHGKKKRRKEGQATLDGALACSQTAAMDLSLDPHVRRPRRLTWFTTGFFFLYIYGTLYF